jgi:hypothetical protein
MSKTRTTVARPRRGLVQAEVGIVGMTVVTLLVSLSGLWFSHELKETTQKVRAATQSIQGSVAAYKTAVHSLDTGVVIITDEGAKSDNKQVEEADHKMRKAFSKAEVETTDCLKLLDEVLRLLNTYETTTVTFAGCALIFALFVVIRQFRL